MWRCLKPTARFTDRARIAFTVGLSQSSADVIDDSYARLRSAIMVSIVRLIGGYKPPFPIPKTQSAFHLHAGFRAAQSPTALLCVSALVTAQDDSYTRLTR